MMESCSMTKKGFEIQNKWLILAISLFLICLLSICCLVVLYNFGEIQSTPAATSGSVSIEEIIANTAQAAQTQTAIVAPTFTELVFTPPTVVQPPTRAATWTTEPTATQFILTIQPSSSEQQQGNCDPHYPDVCINSSPRLICDELRAKGISHFRVLPPDPLGYDGDGDGVGCDKE